MNKLSQISTRWTLIRKADAGGAEGARALEALFVLYQKAISRYAFSLLHDDNAADEVCVEFAHRLSARQFAGAPEEKGSFRKLLKRTTYNLAMNRLREQDPEGGRSLPDEDPAGDDTVFDEEWRGVCLRDAWDLLEEGETEAPYPASPPHYTVLRLRSDNDGATKDDLAKLLSRTLGEEVTAEQFRRWLSEAKARFANHLIDVVGQELGDGWQTRVVAETQELGLYNYCKSALKERGLIP